MEKTLIFESYLTHQPFPVQLEIGSYQNNRCLYIGLIDVSEKYPEPYGTVTVNLTGKVPDYCGYIDLNHMPELEEFIAENKLGEFTGFTNRNGFCEYPLYSFDADRLRELCPDGLAVYEQANGLNRQEQKEKSR